MVVMSYYLIECDYIEVMLYGYIAAYVHTNMCVLYLQ